MTVDQWYLDNLACPRDQLALYCRGEELRCANWHAYRAVDGVPVMLLDNVSQTQHVADKSIKRAILKTHEESDEIYLETLGITEAEKQDLVRLASKPENKIDPIVS